MSALGAMYRAAGDAAVALGLPGFVLRGREEELRERLGESPPGGSPAPLWIHAASLGEVAAAGALVRTLRASGSRAPSRIALSTTTRAGRERAAAIGPDVGPFFLPIDASGPARRAFDRIAPRAVVLVETELWPALLGEAARRDIPWAMASARLGARAASRMRWARSLYAPLLHGAAAIGARTEADAERFLAFGARPESVRVTGDLKTSLEVGPYDPPPEGARFRWIAACSRPGEEQIVLETIDHLARTVPSGEAWIAPRHADRFEEVASLIARSGLPWRRVSVAEPVALVNAAPSNANHSDVRGGPGWRIVLVDRLGVLDAAYRATHAAFVGGSLVPLGGHNPLEGAAAGRPIFVGPHTENCAAAVEALVAGGGARRVTSAADLARELELLARDAAQAERRGRAARDVAARSSSAGRDTIEFFTERGVFG